MLRWLKRRFAEWLLEDLLKEGLKIGENTVYIKPDSIVFQPLTSDPALEPGKLWYRQDIDEWRYSPDGSQTKTLTQNVTTESAPCFSPASYWISTPTNTNYTPTISTNICYKGYDRKLRIAINKSLAYGMEDLTVRLYSQRIPLNDINSWNLPNSLRVTIESPSSISYTNAGVLETANGLSIGFAVIYYDSSNSVVRIDAYAIIDLMQNSDIPFILDPVSNTRSQANTYDRTTKLAGWSPATDSANWSTTTDIDGNFSFASMVDTTVPASTVDIVFYYHWYSSQSNGSGNVDVKIIVG